MHQSFFHFLSWNKTQKSIFVFSEAILATHVHAYLSVGWPSKCFWMKLRGKHRFGGVHNAL